MNNAIILKLRLEIKKLTQITLEKFSVTTAGFQYKCRLLQGTRKLIITFGISVY